MPINLTDIAANTGLSLSNLLPTVVLIIVGYIVDSYLKNRPNRRKTNIWINFLKNDEYVGACIRQYYEIETPKNTWAKIALPMGDFLGVFGYLAFIYLSALVFVILGIKSWSFAYPSLIISSLAIISSTNWTAPQKVDR